MVDLDSLELSASCLQGRRSPKMSYRPKLYKFASSTMRSQICTHRPHTSLTFVRGNGSPATTACMYGSMSRAKTNPIHRCIVVAQNKHRLGLTSRAVTVVILRCLLENWGARRDSNPRKTCATDTRNRPLCHSHHETYSTSFHIFSTIF